MKLTRFNAFRTRPSVRSALCCVGILTATVVCSDASAQLSTGGGGGSQANGDAGGGSGVRFEGGDVDMSAFDGIERAESIGTAARQGFGVNTDAAAGTGLRRGGGGGLGGFGGGLGGLGGLFGGLGGPLGGRQGGAEKPVIRTRLRSAVEVAPMPETYVQRSANRVLGNAPQRSGVRGVNVTMDGRTAILSGVVATEKDRRMSELMIRLEPGVSRIDNRVEVAGN